MKTAENLLKSLGVQNYTNRHIRIINDFLQSGEQDVKKCLDKLGSWDNADLEKAKQWMKSGTKKTITLELLYRDAFNYKEYLDHTVSLEEYPEASKLKEGDDIIMGEYGTPDQDSFFDDGSYDDECDHNILEIVGIKEQQD